MSSRQLAFLGIVAVAAFIIAILTGPMVVDLLLGSPETSSTEPAAPVPPPSDGSQQAPHPAIAP